MLFLTLQQNNKGFLSEVTAMTFGKQGQILCGTYGGTIVVIDYESQQCKC